MPAQSVRTGSKYLVSLDLLGELLSELKSSGYEVIGPRLRDQAIVFDSIDTLDDLPAGWTAEQERGRYRLKRRGDEALFGYSLPVQGLKRFLHPPDVRLTTAEGDNGAFRIVSQPGTVHRYAFLGVRACDLAAVQRLDHILLEDRYVDTVYRDSRKNSFFIAVQCTSAEPTCFCASMQTGPELQTGFDIALTEIADDRRHCFLAQAGTDAGQEMLDRLEAAEAAEDVAETAERLARKAERQSRAMVLDGLPQALYDNFDHPRWEQVAARCLACGNCTLVCPTCFCSTIEDTSDIRQHRAERWRRWDSCFTQNFSYIHGGSVRLSLKSRYRQWLTHKLASWVDQFNEFGCVGCGRCITWCPVGIDITEEAAAVRGNPGPAAPREQH